MFKTTQAFSGFSVNDLAAAKSFYADTLGVDVEDGPMGNIQLNLAGGHSVFVYEKPDHIPATYTILNFSVADIDQAVAALKAKGVTFETYPGLTGDDGIARGRAANRGPDIAWLKDPAGNFLAVLQEG